MGNLTLEIDNKSSSQDSLSIRQMHLPVKQKELQQQGGKIGNYNEILRR